jgi:hypothetical protein
MANKEAQKHKNSRKGLDNMRALIARDLADAGIAGLSADRRFATAYTYKDWALCLNSHVEHIGRRNEMESLSRIGSELHQFARETARSEKDVAGFIPPASFRQTGDLHLECAQMPKAAPETPMSGSYALQRRVESG